MGDGLGSNSHDWYSDNSSGDETEVTEYGKEDRSFGEMSDDSPDIVEETNTEEIYIKEDNVGFVQENFASYLLSPRTKTIRRRQN